MKALFLTKAGDTRAARAADFLRRSGAKVETYSGVWGDPFPKAAESWSGDILISYLSRWVIPAELLKAAGLALNFHPAPPERPGIGGTNWALYENASSFGVTCHHMAPKVDAGRVIAVRRFPVFARDSVHSLSERAWDHQLALFYDIMPLVLAGDPLPRCDTQWSGPARKRTEFADLFRIELGMSSDEVRRRVRATTYAAFRPYLDLGDGVTAAIHATTGDDEKA